MDKQQLNESQASNERLREAIKQARNVISIPQSDQILLEAISETKQQGLATMRAEAIEKMADDWDSVPVPNMDSSDMRKYAKAIKDEVA